MKVIIETAPGIAFTKQAAKDSLGRGEFPLSMQLLYSTQPGFSVEEIALGEQAIAAWSEVAELVACYTDLGVTAEMQARLDAYALAGLIVENRTVPVE